MIDPDSSAGRIEALVEACHARVTAQLHLREGFLALAVSIGGLCGLLFLGTRYFPLPLAALVGCLGLWAAWRRVRHTLPSRYAVAQSADLRAGLSDALATAFHFRGRAGSGPKRAIRAQRRAAADSIREVRPDQLFPPVPQQTRKAAAVLLGVATVLVCLRVGVQEDVSFEPPLASILLSALFGDALAPSGQRGLQAAALEDVESGMPPLLDSVFDPRDQLAPDAAPSELPDELSEEPPAGPQDPPQVEGLIPIAMDEQVGSAPEEDLQAGADGQSAESPDGPQGSLPSELEDWDDEAQSLLDKLKQAFENMLETLDLSSDDFSEPDSAGDPSGGPSDQASAEGGATDSEASELDPSGQSADASMEGGQPGAEAGESASAGSTSGEDSSGDSSSGENASASGTSDGDKTLAEARQLEVLGSLEELYMERAEDMSGEVTVETRLAEQSASVPYSQQDAPRGEGPGAVSRDEIPAAYRTYVQNYFEALRRNSQ